MPAKNPRLTITLEPTLGAQLRRLSELTGNSQSALIADLLKGSTVVFDRLIAVLEAAHIAKGELAGSVVADLDAAQSKLESQLGLALETFGQGTESLLDSAEKVSRRAAGAGGARLREAPAPDARRSASSTPISNRGVRSPRGTSGKVRNGQV